MRRLLIISALLIGVIGCGGGGSEPEPVKDPATIKAEQDRFKFINDQAAKNKK